MLTQEREPDLADRIRQIANNSQTIDIAQFQFIGLDAAKAAYGERWRIERERVSEIARAYVRKRIRDEDLLIPCDNGFVVVFGALESMDAAITAHSVGHALNRFFLGEDSSSSFKVDVSHQTLPAGNLASVIGGARSLDMSKAKRGEILPGADVDQNSFTLRFQPVWDVKREAITAWFAEAVEPVSGRRIPGYRFEPDVVARRPFFEIDDVTLRASEVALKKLFASGKKAMLGVSIHVSSLVKLESRTRIFNTLSQLDGDLMHYRVIRLSGIVPGFPRLYLNDMVKALAARAPHVVIGMSMAEEDLATALDCEAWGVSCSSDTGFPDDPAFLAKVRKNAAMVRQRHKRFFVEADLTPDQARLIAECEVDFIASPLVWQPSRNPGGVFKWAAAGLDENNWVVDGRL